MRYPSRVAVFVLVLVAVVFAAGAETAAADGLLLFEGVTGDRQRIVFSHAGDLWTVPRAGGAATALTSGPETDLFPTLSPDGSQLAFSRSAGGNLDIWVMAMPGEGTGSTEPRRLTYHPKADLVRSWSADGKSLLFATIRDGDGLWRLYTIAADGVFPAPLALPKGYDGALSPAGDRVAYAPVDVGVEFGDYRYYRGGLTSPLWIATLADGEVEVVAGASSNHRHPMWSPDGGTLYFTSDADGVFNLYAHELASGRRRQLTGHRDYGVRWADLAADAIVYDQGGALHLYDLAAGVSRPLAVTVAAKRDELAPRRVDAARFLATAVPAPGGDRLALEVRGEIVVAAADGSGAENLTRSPGAAERDPAFSPDGRRIAYFSDASGEYELHVRTLAGAAAGEVTAIPVEERPSFYRRPVFSPDGRRIAFSGKRLGLWLADLDSGRTELVERSDYLAQELWQPAFSPDGRFLAYARGLPDHRRSVFLLDLETGRRVRVSGEADAEWPVFDANGRYLHFLASNNAPLAAGEEIWGVLSPMMAAPMVTSTVHTVLLSADEPPPFLPFSRSPNPAARAGEARASSVELDGIERRVVRLPVPDRAYVSLAAGGPGVLLASYRAWPEAPGSRDRPSTPLARYALTAENAFEELVEDVDEVRVAVDGATALYRRGDDLRLLPLGGAAAGGQSETGDGAGEAPPGREVDLSGLTLEVDPAAEWRQMFREAWRMMRDSFYDPGHHGQDLAALESHFAAYLPHVTRRSDLNRLFEEMLGHVSISHMSIRGGDLPEPGGSRERTGTLGAELSIENGRYRIERIYRVASPAASSTLVRSAPLDQPGVDAREGDYLLAVDGTPVDASRNLYASLAGTAYRPTVLRLAADPEGRQAREVTVVPVGGDNSIKRAAFYAAAERRVEELSGGRLGYIALPNFGPGAIFEFVRQLAAARGRQGLILDQRFGPGGITSDYLIQMLATPPLHRYAFPYGEDLTVPTLAPPPGPMVLLINEHNASASETFPLMFDLAGLGTIVGKRTMGAGTGGALYYPRLADGGRITIPNRASYHPRDGRWAENHGIEPDVEVEWWPHEWRRGVDPQIERAVAIALEALKEAPEEPRRPEYPVHP